MAYVENFAKTACDIMPNSSQVRTPVGMKRVELHSSFIKETGVQLSPSNFNLTLRENFPNLKFASTSKFAQCDECEECETYKTEMAKTRDPEALEIIKENRNLHCEFQMSDSRSFGT